MQNFQVLTGTGGCSKYVCKYIEKIDENNYVVVLVDGSGKLVTKATFLYNIKVTHSKIGKYKDREKHKKGSRKMYKSYVNASYDVKISGGHDKPRLDSILNISIGDTSGYYSIF